MKYFVKAKLSDNISETPEGFLVCIGVPIARTGEMVYGAHEVPLDPGPNGEVIIIRDEKEVFRPETIASFEGKSVTISHPEEFVDPKNWKTLTVGTMQNIRRGKGEFGDSLLADLLVTDVDAINLVKNGLREVSCGYEADYEQDEAGKGRQLNIIGNHLALVEQGRAGSAYAINDHKGKGNPKMKLADKIKKIFAKAQDEALELAKDAESQQDPETGKPAMADAAGYDELCKMVKDLAEKVGALSKPKDEKKDEPKKEEKKDDESKDGEEEKEEESKDEDGDINERLKVLEASVSKLLESMASKDGEEEEKSEDADEEDEESEDDDFEESSLVGDSVSDVKSRAEILAPGIKMSKTIKSDALKAAFATKDGEKIIKSINGGKAPDYKSDEKVNTLFVAASELMKASRKSDFASTKRTTDEGDNAPVAMTADKLNEINAKFYKGAH